MAKPVGYVVDADTGKRMLVYAEDLVWPDDEDDPNDLQPEAYGRAPGGSR